MTSNASQVATGKMVYLDANVIIHLIQYAIADRDQVLNKWPAKAQRRVRAILRLVEAGAYQMHRARAGEIQEEAGPRLHTSLLSLSQAAHALQLYHVMSKRVMNQVPYRELTTFSNVDKEILPTDLQSAHDSLAYFVDTWLADKGFKTAIILHPLKDSGIDLSVCFPLGREFTKHAYLDAEDALHLATAVVAKCSHFATTDSPLRRALEELRKDGTCQTQLQLVNQDWQLPTCLNPTKDKVIEQLGWLLPS